MRVPLTLIDFLERGALYGDGVAVVDEPGGPASLGAISYAELERRSRGMACALDRLGVPHGARVAIVSPNSARFVISLFGVSGFGRVLVPINFRLNAEEIEYIVGHSGADVLLIDPELADNLADVGAKHRVVLDGVADAELFAPTADDPAPWEPDEDATASINYTSGTTARPKGVQLTHRTLWLHAASIGWHLRIGAPRRVPAGPAAVPLQRLGVAVRADGDGRQAGHAAPGRRRRDPPAGRATRGDVDLRGAGRARRCPGRERRPRRRAGPRTGDDADAPRGRSATNDDPRARRGRARLGAHPRLRAHRELAAAHDQHAHRR